MNCWFCSVREANTDHTYVTQMYGDVDAKTTSSQTQVRYNVRRIEVPRCADCHSRHVIALYATVLAIVMAVALLVAVLFAVYGWTAQWIWGLWSGLAFGLLLGALAIRFLILKGIYSIGQARKAYPEISELLEKCYRFGRRPKGQLPESDAPCPEAGDQAGTPQKQDDTAGRQR